jgi:hypothetical protein
MFQIDYEKKVKKKTVDGPGFSLKIPTSFSSRSENDPQGQWGYGEFFQTNTFDGRYEPQTNMFFFYWKVTNGELSGKQANELIEAVCKEKVFSGEHSMAPYEISPIIFKRYPAFILKYRFSHHDPKAAGKANFFVINNTRQEKIFILGTLVESVGSNMIENETMAWIEDYVINSFRFKKNTG